MWDLLLWCHIFNWLVNQLLNIYLRAIWSVVQTSPSLDAAGFSKFYVRFTTDELSRSSLVSGTPGFLIFECDPSLWTPVFPIFYVRFTTGELRRSSLDSGKHICIDATLRVVFWIKIFSSPVIIENVHLYHEHNNVQLFQQSLCVLRLSMTKILEESQRC